MLQYPSAALCCTALYCAAVIACHCQLPGAEQLSSGEEDEDEDEEEEVKVEPPQKKHKQQHQQSQLRKAAPQHPAQTPQPVKQASVVQQRKAPATAPAKSSGAAAASQDREYLQALKAALLKTGPSKLAKVRAGASAAWGC